MQQLNNLLTDDYIQSQIFIPKYEVPAYQAIDLLLNGKSNNHPIRGWYINIADDQGRMAIPDRFAYTEKEAAEKIALAIRVTKWPKAVWASPCWIHDEDGRKCHTPR